MPNEVSQNEVLPNEVSQNEVRQMKFCQIQKSFAEKPELLSKTNLPKISFVKNVKTKNKKFLQKLKKSVSSKT